MFGLTPLGIAHTAVSLVALVSGAIALARDGKIVPDDSLGKLYLWTTVVTCLTGFGIFQHGGFGKPHVLGIITLAVLAATAVARSSNVFGRGAPYVVTIGYSATFFFHLVPGVTETFTRLPAGAPVFSSPEDPGLAMLTGVIFLFFLAGVALQVRSLRTASVSLGAFYRT